MHVTVKRRSPGRATCAARGTTNIMTYVHGRHALTTSVASFSVIHHGPLIAQSLYSTWLHTKTGLDRINPLAKFRNTKHIFLELVSLLVLLTPLNVHKPSTICSPKKHVVALQGFTETRHVYTVYECAKNNEWVWLALKLRV